MDPAELKLSKLQAQPKLVRHRLCRARHALRATQAAKLSIAEYTSRDLYRTLSLSDRCFSDANLAAVRAQGRGACLEAALHNALSLVLGSGTGRAGYAAAYALAGLRGGIVPAVRLQAVACTYQTLASSARLAIVRELYEEKGALGIQDVECNSVCLEASPLARARALR